jgi:hypothetical protein
MVLIHEDYEFTRFPIRITNQGSMADDLITSPGEESLTRLEEVLQPVMADFRVFGRKPLRGRFWGEEAIHLKNKWKIFGTTDPYLEAFSGFVGSRIGISANHKAVDPNYLKFQRSQLSGSLG